MRRPSFLVLLISLSSNQASAAAKASEGDVTSILPAVSKNETVVLRLLEGLEPNSSDAHAQLGDLLLQTNSVETARRETAASLELNPQNYSANRTLMRLHRLDNDPRLAAQTERLKTLAEENDANLRLLKRTIEARPW